MSDLVKTFAELLRQFALSVDIVDQATFNRVRDHVVEYMRNKLKTAYFGLMTRRRSTGGPACRRPGAAPTRGPQPPSGAGRLARQVSIAFDQQRPLWVVAADGGRCATSTTQPGTWTVVRGLRAAPVHVAGQGVDEDLDDAAARPPQDSRWA